MVIRRDSPCSEKYVGMMIIVNEKSVFFAKVHTYVELTIYNVKICSHLGKTDCVERAHAVLQGYLSCNTLTEDEKEVLFTAVCARFCK